MSEQAAEAPARNPAGKKENIFTRKIGPMPMWAWLAIVSVGIIAWAWYQNKKSPSTAPTDTANASQVPQFVNQTYTTVQPPTAPVPGKPPPDNDGKDKDGKGKGGKGKGGDSDEAIDTTPGHSDEGVPFRRHRRRHPTHHRREAATTQAARPGMA